MRWFPTSKPLRMLVLALAAALSAAPVMAASYDPELTWRTLTTEHFNITFHQGEEQLANELADTAEALWAELTADLDNYPPRSTEIVLVDHTDVANGYAMTIPVNTIVIFVTAPQETSSLGLYEDWLDAITTHEYAHILHLDTVEGYPKALRYIFGRIISVNHVSPWWIIEGQATYHETRHTTGGRGRASQAQMILRMATLEDNFPRLGSMDGWMSDAPGGNVRYLFGQSFLQYIADHSSEDAWTRWNHTYGSWLPYLLPARQTFGASFRSLYNDWKALLHVEYGELSQRLAERGLTQGTRVSASDHSCSGPVWSPDGEHLVFACSDRRSGSAIYLADGDGLNAEVEVDDQFAKTFTWRPDGQAFAYSSTHIVNRFNLWEDIYFHELGSGSSRRLTNGARTKDPAFSPDGADLWVVKNEVQNNNLYRLRIDQSLEPLTEYTDHRQLSTPRWSPDGNYVALSVWHEGFRDIWIYRADGTPYRRITQDVHIDRDASWSADGATLLFVSDRTGIPNIYAVDLATEELFQVTNVLGGAFQPSMHPDGQKLAWQEYHTHGMEIIVAAVDRSAWTPKGLLPRPMSHGEPLARVLPGATETLARGGPGSGSVGPVDARSRKGREVLSHGLADQPVRGAQIEDRTRGVEVERKEEDYPFDHPVRRYNPLPTLFPPRYLYPTLYQTSFGVMGAVSTGGVDTLRHYAWNANANYRTDANSLGGGVSFVWNRWTPIMGWGVSRYAVPYGDIYIEPDTVPGANLPMIQSVGKRYWDQRHLWWTSISFPLTDRSGIWARYRGVWRTPQDSLPDDVYYGALPTRGVLSSLQVGWGMGRSQAFPYSISPENARVLSISAKWTSRYLGSFTLVDANTKQPFDQLQITAEWKEFIGQDEATDKLHLPWWPANHVLVIRAAGGVSIGDRLRYGSFRLGGNYGISSYYRLPDEYESVRGFPVATVSGDWYYLGTLEYRFPLIRIDRGAGTLPLFVQKFSGAVFTDVGDAFDTLDAATGPLIGVGGELRLTGIAGWAVGFQLRAGYAFAVYGPGGYDPLQVETLYFRLGTSL
jgi:Tol biopolymer transport system component